MIAKRLIIHPGWSKTGTTSLQNYFAANYERYLEHGVLYPKAGRLIDNAHHDLALSIASREGLKPTKSTSSILEQIVQEARARTVDHVLISSELMPLPNNSAEFADFCDQFESLELIFSVRKQSELIQSLYKHLLRDPSIVFHDSFVQIFAAHSSWLNFDAEITKWEKWKPAAKAFVVTGQSNLLSEFGKCLNLPLFENRLPFDNRSPTNIVALVLARSSIARERMSIDERSNFNAFLVEALKPFGDRFGLLERDAVELIEAMYLPSNQSLAQRFPAAQPLLSAVEDTATSPPPSPSLVQSYAELLEHIFRNFIGNRQ